MNYRKFVIIILCVLYACLLSLALINIVVDPYQIFQTPFLKQQSQPNERYSKIEFLKKNKGRYNSYIMGSSRVGLTNTDILVKYLHMAKFYNLSTALAVPYEHLLHLKYFIKNGYPVRNLYIGLDLDLCLGVKMHKDKDLLLKLHPGVLNRNLIGYYWSYLSVFPKTDIRRKLKLNFSRKVSPIQISGKDGVWTFGEEAENGKVFFEDPTNNDNITIKNKVKEENVEGLRELVTLCRQHDINLILFITPHNKFFMDRFVVEDYLTFLRKLSEITSFWDFGGYNSITTNNENYLDRSHYKPSISRMIAARIFNDKTLTVPEDFGVWVTKENIDSHLENLEMTIKKYRSGGTSLDLETETKAALGGLR
jgi:hypothetical protein